MVLCFVSLFACSVARLCLHACACAVPNPCACAVPLEALLLPTLPTAGFDDPEVMRAVNDIAANPQNFKKYQKNEKVRRSMGRGERRLNGR